MRAAEPTEEQWVAAATELASRQAEIAEPGRAQLRDALIELDDLMRAAPEHLEDGYRRIPEPELADRAKEHAEGLADSCAWPVQAKDDATGTLGSLAVQIRAVDTVLYLADPTYDRKPTRAHIKSRWRGLGGTFVIPAPRGRDYGRADQDRHTYRRRGILRHRLVPATLRGLQVEFAIAADRPLPAEGSGSALGAALLPNLTIDAPPRAGGTFLVEEVVCPRILEVVAEQVGRAHADGVDAVVWPELTVDAAALEAISDALGRVALEDDARPPAVVVAGSRHVEHEGAMRNLASVLSGTGGLIGTYEKVILFEDNEHGVEAVEPGRKILVVVTERFVATVAICKDYCDLGVANRWRDLDVDLVLVPSMGDAKTMEGHRAMATHMRLYRDQRAFVVQQAEPRHDGDPLGYVLDAGRAVPEDIDATRTESTWSVHRM